MYRHYVLALLALSYGFSVMDRQIMSIVLEALRLEFALSDTQLGFLSGLAFAVLYAVLAVPIARFADHHSRVNIIAIAVGIWSLVTAVCGATQNFTQLLLARVGVGVGEAGGTAPSHSLISDYYSVNERSMAISVFSMGATLGSLVGLLMGGFIVEHYGWRMVFVIAGLPGILLAILFKLTVKEPPRGAFESESENASTSGNFKDTLLSLWRNEVYRRVTIAHTTGAVVGYAIFSWLPTFYLRQFDLGQGAVGTIIGTMFFAAGAPGLLVGGYLSDRLGRLDERWRARIPGLALSAALPSYLMAFWTENQAIATLLFGLGVFCYQVSHGPGLAIVQIVVPPNARAQAAAMVFFFSNLVGLGMGPVLVGYVSDMNAVRYGDASLSIALSSVMLLLLVAIIWYWRTVTSIQESIMRKGNENKEVTTNTPTSSP
jgi:MFS family permease